MTPDVPLEHVQLVWNEGPDAEAAVQDFREPHDRYPHLLNSCGACDADWDGMTDEQRLTRLFSAMWATAALERTPVAILHAALFVVPAYRDWAYSGGRALDFVGDAGSLTLSVLQAQAARYLPSNLDD